MERLSWGRPSHEALGLAVLMPGVAAGLVAGFNPSLFTKRTFRSDKVDGQTRQDTANDLRIGLALGGALTVVTGTGAAILTGSAWPMVAAVASLGIFIGETEWAIRNPHNRRSSIADQ